VLGWELERSRGLRWWESTRWACRRWRRREARAGARGEQDREIGGRLDVVWRKGNGRERGGGPGRGGLQRGVKDMAGNSPRPSGKGGGAIAQTGESSGVRSMRCGAADWWGRAATCPVVSGGVWEEERRVRQCGGGGLTGGPRPHSARARFKLSSKPIRKYSNGSNEI
jgi:hypothetical protein